MFHIVNVKEYHKQKELDAKEAARRRASKFNRRAQKVKRIRDKPEDKWTADELRRMLTYKKRAGDKASSDVKDMDTLRKMWRSRKHRTSPTCTPLNSDDEDDADVKVEEPEATEVDDMLHLPEYTGESLLIPGTNIGEI